MMMANGQKKQNRTDRLFSILKEMSKLDSIRTLGYQDSSKDSKYEGRIKRQRPPIRQWKPVLTNVTKTQEKMIRDLVNEKAEGLVDRRVESRDKTV